MLLYEPAVDIWLMYVEIVTIMHIPDALSQLAPHQPAAHAQLYADGRLVHVPPF